MTSKGFSFSSKIEKNKGDRDFKLTRMLIIFGDYGILADIP